jgi:hypothetical protein
VLRRKLVAVVRLDRCDAVGRHCIAKSARFLLSRGYNTAGWCGSNGRAAKVWAAGLAVRPKLVKKGEDKPGRAEGLVFRARAARRLELEIFAEAAWRGAAAAAGPTPRR